MTTKRTHGPCTCQQWHPNAGHEADCPALYSAQQEPDALTRLVRLIRESDAHPTDIAEAMDLISEAREEKKKSVEIERKRADEEEDAARDLVVEVRRLAARLKAYEAPE